MAARQVAMLRAFLQRAKAQRTRAAPGASTIRGFTAGSRAGVSAAAAAGLAGCCWVGQGLGAAGPVRLEAPAAAEAAKAYEPPARLGRSFATLPRSPPSSDKAARLAWAVKHLEVGVVREVLAQWPHGATLIDSEDNSLFHLVASEPSRCAAQPTRAEEVIRLLLQSGWDVVDQKNRKGERAEVVAARSDRLGVASRMLRTRSQAFLEKLRSEDDGGERLELLCETSPCPWDWTCLLQDEKRRSWAGLLSRAIPEEKCKELLDIALAQAPWQDLPDVPRKVAWFVSKEFADTPYRYSGLEYPATVFPPWMEEIRSEVCRQCGIPADDLPNSCNVNVYNDHKGEVGWHSDDEVLFQGLAGDTRIVSFSLGSARDFCWRLQGTTECLGSVPLGDGDIMTMEGLFQKHYKHSVPACDKPCGKRVNFTFRWIKTKAHAVDADVKGIKA